VTTESDAARIRELELELVAYRREVRELRKKLGMEIPESLKDAPPPDDSLACGHPGKSAGKDGDCTTCEAMSRAVWVCRYERTATTKWHIASLTCSGSLRLIEDAPRYIRDIFWPNDYDMHEQLEATTPEGSTTLVIIETVETP
jgi:hypothetical protein